MLLMQIAPADEEVAAMREYDGTFEDLAPPEKVPAMTGLHTVLQQPVLRQIGQCIKAFGSA